METLDATGKQRYKEKLESAGLSIVDDPYLPENNSRFSADLSSFPQIEYRHIFAWLLRESSRNLH